MMTSDARKRLAETALHSGQARCSAGKHVNCTGEALDFLGEFVDCDCQGCAHFTHHDPAVRQLIVEASSGDVRTTPTTACATSTGPWRCAPCSPGRGVRAVRQHVLGVKP